MSEIFVNSDNFDEVVVKSKVPVLIDFYATWCAPCRMLSPIIREISEQFDGKLAVAKVNVDEAEDIARRFNVSSIPMLALIENGHVMKTIIGYHEKDEIIDSFNLK